MTIRISIMCQLLDNQRKGKQRLSFKKFTDLIVLISLQPAMAFIRITLLKIQLWVHSVNKNV